MPEDQTTGQVVALDGAGQCPPEDSNGAPACDTAASLTAQHGSICSSLKSALVLHCRDHHMLFLTHADTCIQTFGVNAAGASSSPSGCITD